MQELTITAYEMSYDLGADGVLLDWKGSTQRGAFGCLFRDDPGVATVSGCMILPVSGYCATACGMVYCSQRMTRRFRMNIGEKIRYFRLQQHMTQEKLARGTRFLSGGFQMGARRIAAGLTLVARIAAVLGVSCDALLTEDDLVSRRAVEETLERAKRYDLTVEASYCRCVELLEAAMVRYPQSLPLYQALAEVSTRRAACIRSMKRI